jgi:adenine deaminase
MTNPYSDDKIIERLTLLAEADDYVEFTSHDGIVGLEMMGLIAVARKDDKWYHRITQSGRDKLVKLQSNG